MIVAMDSQAAPFAHAPASPLERTQIDDRYKWDLGKIFRSWTAWDSAYRELEVLIDRFARLEGTLSTGAASLLEALSLRDDIGQIGYKVWYFASLKYDEDQRDNQINARRQQVQILFARQQQANGIDIGGTYRGPLAVNDGHLGVQKSAVVLEDFHTCVDQLIVKSTGGMMHQKIFHAPL